MTPLSHRDRRDRGQQPLRVLLVEDSPLLVQRISELVEDLPNIELVGTAGSEPEAVARLDAGDVDAVILDLQLHTGSGFGVLRALQRRTTGPAVIVFTNFAIGAYRETAFALGRPALPRQITRLRSLAGCPAGVVGFGAIGVAGSGGDPAFFLH